MLNYTGIVERTDTITVDGYSTLKSKKAIIKEVAKFIQKNYKVDTQFILNNIDESLFQPSEDCNYFFTLEEVGCASQINEDTDEMEYKEGNYYFCIRLDK